MGTITFLVLIFLLCVVFIWIIAILLIKNNELKLKLKEKDFGAKQIERNYVEFFQNSPLLYFVLNPRGIVMDCNKRASEVLQMQKTDLIGKPLKDYFETFPSGKFDQYIKNLIEERTVSFEVDFRDAYHEILSGTAYCQASLNPEGEIMSIQMVVLIYHVRKTFLRDEESEKRIKESLNHSSSSSEEA